MFLAKLIRGLITLVVIALLVTIFGVTSVQAQPNILNPIVIGPRVYNLCELNPGLCSPPIVVPAIPEGCLPHSLSPGAPPGSPSTSRVVYQQFPANGPLETAWYVTYDYATAEGLYITSAYFKPNPNSSWIKVLARAGLSEIFVPYQPGQPRYLDLSTFSFDLVDATADDAGRCGQLLGNPAKVIREVVDKGVLWKDDREVARGQKLILWATLDAANYNYLISYSFHDDGTIEFRGAGTAANLPGRELTSHVHNLLWRVDVDLDGPNGDSVYLSRHLEPLGSQSWTDTVEKFNNGMEGNLQWNPKEFNSLRVRSTNLNNSNGLPTSYDLRPLYRGVARHAETWMQSDMWVTRYKPRELFAPLLEMYVADQESVDNTNIVLWQNTPLLHVPRGEDGEYDANGNWKGVALAMWGGFDLRPRNLFDNTPFHTP